MQAKEQYACALRLEPQNNAWEEEAKSLGFVKKHVMEGWCITTSHTNVKFDGSVLSFSVRPHAFIKLSLRINSC